MPLINTQLSIQEKNVTNKTQQKYYHYLHFLYTLALNGRLIEKKIAENMLAVTGRWKQFQALSDSEKHCFLLETFWVDLDWNELAENKTY